MQEGKIQEGNYATTLFSTFELNSKFFIFFKASFATPIDYLNSIHKRINFISKFITFGANFSEEF